MTEQFNDRYLFLFITCIITPQEFSSFFRGSDLIQQIFAIIFFIFKEDCLHKHFYLFPMDFFVTVFYIYNSPYANMKESEWKTCWVPLESILTMQKLKQPQLFILKCCLEPKMLLFI